MIMRHLMILCTLLIGMMMAAPLMANTPARAANNVPLVVITYNQPRVHYSKQLYQAMSRAVAIKPDVMVTVSSFVPKIGSDSYKAQMRQASARQRQQLVQDLNAMGIPKDRIRVTTDYVTDSKYHELYVYVD
jgi:exonuclease VII large subunit